MDSHSESEHKLFLPTAVKVRLEFTEHESNERTEDSLELKSLPFCLTFFQLTILPVCPDSSAACTIRFPPKIPSPIQNMQNPATCFRCAFGPWKDNPSACHMHNKIPSSKASCSLDFMGATTMKTDTVSQKLLT